MSPELTESMVSPLSPLMDLGEAAIMHTCPDLTAAVSVLAEQLSRAPTSTAEQALQLVVELTKRVDRLERPMHEEVRRVASMAWRKRQDYWRSHAEAGGERVRTEMGLLAEAWGQVARELDPNGECAPSSSKETP